MFFETQDAKEAKQIIDRHNVTWIVSYDADRVAQNSAQILGNPVPKNAFCYLLDRRASEVPPFLRLIAQTDTSSSFAWRNHKKAHRAREKFDRAGLRHNTIMC